MSNEQRQRLSAYTLESLWVVLSMGAVFGALVVISPALAVYEFGVSF